MNIILRDLTLILRKLLLCEAHVNEFQRRNLNSTFMFYIKNAKMKDLEVNLKLIQKFKNVYWID